MENGNVVENGDVIRGQMWKTNVLIKVLIYVEVKLTSPFSAFFVFCLLGFVLRIEYVWVTEPRIQIWNWKACQRASECEKEISGSETQGTTGQVWENNSFVYTTFCINQLFLKKPGLPFWSEHIQIWLRWCIVLLPNFPGVFLYITSVWSRFTMICGQVKNIQQRYCWGILQSS